MGKRNTEENLNIWTLRVKEWEDSKLNMVKWCAANNETIDTLRYWKEQVYRSETPVSSQEFESKQVFNSEKFQELTCDENVYTNNASIEIRIKDITIAVTQDFEEKTLGRLLSFLRRAS